MRKKDHTQLFSEDIKCILWLTNGKNYTCKFYVKSMLVYLILQRIYIYVFIYYCILFSQYRKIGLILIIIAHKNEEKKIKNLQYTI